MELTRRFVALATSVAISLPLLYLSRFAGPLTRALAYLLLALAISAVPSVLRRV